MRIYGGRRKKEKEGKVAGWQAGAAVFLNLQSAFRIPQSQFPLSSCCAIIPRMDKNYNVRQLDLATWASFMMFAASAIIVAVSLPEISASFSTNLSEGGGIETARSFVVLIVLLLAGMLAQRWGKKRFLTLGQYLIAAGLLLASFAPNYATLVVAMMITGIGAGFSEALLNPLIIETHPRQSGKYLNIGHAFYPVGVMLGALLFGELLTMGASWRFLFRVAAGGALIVAILFTVSRFPPEERDNTSYPKLFTGIVAQGMFWLFAIAIFLGASIESAFTFWSRSYVGAYLSEVPRSGALAVVLFAAAMAAGRFLAGFLAGRTSLSNIMIGSGLLGTAVSFLIPTASSLTAFYGLLALAGLATACFWPTIMAEAEAYLDVNSTILFILLACVGIIGFGLTPWVLGLIGDTAELRAGFAVIPLLFIALVLLLVFERRLNLKKEAAEKERAAAAAP